MSKHNKPGQKPAPTAPAAKPAAETPVAESQLSQLVVDVREFECNGSKISLLIVKPGIFGLQGTKDRLLPILGEESYKLFVDELKSELAPDAPAYPTKPHMEELVKTIQTLHDAKAGSKITPDIYNTGVGISSAVMTVCWDDFSDRLPEGEEAKNWDVQVNAVLEALVGDTEEEAPADPKAAAEALAAANGTKVEAKPAAEQQGPKNTAPTTKAPESNLPATEAQLANPLLNTIAAALKQQAADLKLDREDMQAIEERFAAMKARYNDRTQTFESNLTAFLDAVQNANSGAEIVKAADVAVEEETAM